MSDNVITVYKRNYLGESVWKYQGSVIERGDTYVCLRAFFERKDEADLGFVTFRQGDLFIEWHFSDRWYNVFQVHDGDSERIKGWYCNITRPAIITPDTIAADDLELDVWIMPNGTMMLLDEKEFGDLDLPTDERMAALRAVQTIRHDTTERQGPFRSIT
jgi:protein associated with RNAse G/E